MTIKKQLARSHIAMVLIPVLAAGALLVLGLGLTLVLLDRVYLPRLGISLEEQQRQQRRQELIVGMSHDLKSPMTSIRAYTEALLDGVARDEDARSRYLRTIQAKERDMEGMVDRALLARVTANLLDNSRKYGGRENVRVAISARAAGRIIHSRGWRRLRHQRRARPMSRANRVRVPTLRIRLAIGAPLRKGENSWSMGITEEEDALNKLARPNTAPNTVACTGPSRHPARMGGI